MKVWRRHPWSSPWRAMAVLITLAALLCPAVAGAGEHGDGDREEHDHDRARRAVQAGDILPLQEVLARLARRQPGQVLEVELEREAGRWVYEIKLLRPDGRLLKLELDARDGAPLPDARR